MKRLASYPRNIGIGVLRRAGRKGTAIALCAFFLTNSVGDALSDPGPQRPSINLPEKPPILSDNLTDLPSAGEFAICIARRSYQGCCSSHQGVQDIRDDKLICGDDAPSRTCDGVIAPLKGCCSGHGGIFGVNTDGVVMCNDQTSSPSCHLGLCDDDQQQSDEIP